MKNETGKFDEFGNRVEYIKSETDNDDNNQPLKNQPEDFNEFQDDARKKFNRIRFEGKAAKGGEKVGRGARSLLEFAGDSLGLLILKSNGNQDLAKRIIKTGRSAGETAENILGKVFLEGGKVVGQVAEKVDVDSLREKAHEVKEEVGEKVSQSDLLEKVKPEEIKNKMGEAFQKVSEKVREVKSDLVENPETAEKKRADLEAKIAAFEKLYEDESIEWELHSNEGYKPEEVKETRDKY